MNSQIVDKAALDAHLMSTCVPVEKDDSKEVVQMKVYIAWAKECEKLGFLKEAEFYRKSIKGLYLPSGRWPGSEDM